MPRRVKIAAKSIHHGRNRFSLRRLNRRQKEPVIVEATAQVGFVRVVGSAVAIQLGHELAGNDMGNGKV
jgi:hypothetical protein